MAPAAAPEQHRRSDVSDVIDGGPAVVLGDRFVEAVAFACDLHRDQVRKGTRLPYSSHLLGVAANVLEQDGADEDEAIAALLHDAIEDQSHQVDLDAIRARFGDAVAGIVADCTDAETEPKPPWRRRKVAYLAHLEHVGVPSLRVSLADKLHNARTIVADAAAGDPRFWSRFNAPPVAQRWYYERLAEVFLRRLGTPLAHELRATVDRLTATLACELTIEAPAARLPAWVGAGTLTAAAADLHGAVGEVAYHHPCVALGDPDPLDDAGAAYRMTVGEDEWVLARADTGSPARPWAIFIRG